MKNAPNDTNFHPAQRVEITDYTTSWQKKLQQCVTDIDELFNILDLPSHLKPAAASANQLFPLKVPRRYLALIEQGNLSDPLLKQILPLAEEHIENENFTTDPLQELAAMTSPGVVHKYAGRSLLTLTGACAVNCRYCFRRHFPYQNANPSHKHWQKSLAHFQNDPSLSEIILSGGDPLLVSDNRLQAIINDIEDIAHITTLRIHSRVPVVLPERITPELLKMLEKTRLQIVLVIHCNHPQEIDDFAKQQLLALNEAGITLLNQSVLLRGVNDTTDILKTLSQRLFECSVLPYYLHLLDRVRGTTHFEVEEHQAQALYKELLAALPGYLVPKLVRELPGQANKSPV